MMRRMRIAALAVAGAALVLTFSSCERAGPVAAEPDGPDPEAAQACRTFAKRKNAGDKKAVDLLGRVPKVPDSPVSPEEAESLQTDFFLRCDLRITRFHYEPGTIRRFALETEGNAVAPRFAIRGENGGKPVQRTVWNPVLVVEVRDGKLFGVRAGL